MLAWLSEIATFCFSTADENESFPIGMESALSAEVLEQLSALSIK